MTSLFISYRRTDSQEVVGRIYDRLAAQFCPIGVFLDLDNIPPGKRFAEVLQDALRQASVALVVIGPSWTSIANERGVRRLDEPTDFVRLEVEAAIALGLPIVPVLVSNASLPPASDLPESIRVLVEYQGVRVRTDPDFHRDMDRLIDALARYFKPVDHLAHGQTEQECASKVEETEVLNLPEERIVCNPHAYKLVVKSLLQTKLIQEGLATLRAFHLKSYRGRSGQLHQTDVSFEIKVGELELLFIAGCNDSGRKVTVDEMMVFSYRLRDIGAHKGLLVSTIGFEPGTVDLAKTERIALLTAREGRLVDSWCGLMATYVPHWVHQFGIEVNEKESALQLTGLRHVTCNSTFNAVPFQASSEPSQRARKPEVGALVYFLLPNEVGSEESLERPETRDSGLFPGRRFRRTIGDVPPHEIII